MGRTLTTGEQIRDDSLTGDDVVEESLLPEKIPFSDVGFTSDNVRDAIVEAKQTAIESGEEFKYVLDEDLVLENNESKIVGGKIVVGGNKIILKGNSILRIS